MPLDFEGALYKEVSGLYALTPGVLAEYLRLQTEDSRFVQEVNDRPQIRSPAEAATFLLNQVFQPFHVFDQEELWVLLLNTKNIITHKAMAYRGNINTVIIRPAELFKPAVRFNAPAIIIAHCHPSGDPTPSPEDTHVTRRIRQAADLLSIELIDHLVIGDGRWVSMKERGLGFE
jgi:DNA repair protein RadC